MVRWAFIAVILGFLSSACQTSQVEGVETPLVSGEGEAAAEEANEGPSRQNDRILALLSDASFSFEGSSIANLHFFGDATVELSFARGRAAYGVSLPEDSETPVTGTFRIETVFGGLIQIVMDFPEFKLLAILGDDDGQILILITSEGGEIVGYRIKGEISDIPTWTPPPDPSPAEEEQPEALTEAPSGEAPSEGQEPQVTEPPVIEPSPPPPLEKPKKENPGKGKGRGRS